MATIAAPEAQVSGMEANRPRLLIIDDNAANRTLMRRLFDEDYQVEIAQNGREGLSLVASQPFDVVLLDVMMPDMDGFTVLKLLRDAAETAELPVILISSMAEADYVVQGLQLGANDYLTKPVNALVARARVDTQVKLKQLNDERKRTIAQLERLNQLRDYFFRVASHDLKNPLANLRLAHHELRYLIPKSPDADLLQSSIDATLDEMQALIEDFLDAAALQDGKLKLELDCVSVSDCIWHVVEQYAIHADRKNITVRVGATSGLVMTNGQRLVQVIGNLVSNAIKYSPPQTTMDVWAEQHGDRTRIYIGDQGPGIPLEERKYLFHEFAKLSTRPTGGESSTGLGLWIVKHLMTLLLGDVGADFPPDGGSVFWVEVPTCD